MSSMFTKIFLDYWNSRHLLYSVKKGQKSTSQNIWNSIVDSKFLFLGTLGYRINVHVRLFFFVQFPLYTILIRYCTIIFSRPIYYPVRLFSTVRLLFSAFFLRAFLHFLKSESSLIRMFFGSNVLFIKYNVSNS